MKFRPRADIKILIIFALIVIPLLSALVYWVLNEGKCDKHRLFVVFGKPVQQQADGVINVPSQLAEFIRQDVAECDHCFFTDDRVKLSSILSTSKTCPSKEISLYSPSKKDQINESELPNSDWEIADSLPAAFGLGDQLTPGAFESIVTTYKNDHQISIVIAYSSSKADSNCSVVIANDTFPVYTSMDSVSVLRCRLLANHFDNNMQLNVLLLYNPPCACNGQSRPCPDSTLICHQEGGGVTTGKTIKIAAKDWSRHQSHGDTEGPCITPILICHNEGGMRKAILIPPGEWPIHQAHGDSKGYCPTMQVCCRKATGSSKGGRSLTIDKGEWPLHQAHGDVVGDCPLPCLEIFKSGKGIAWTPMGSGFQYRISIANDVSNKMVIDPYIVNSTSLMEFDRLKEETYYRLKVEPIKGKLIVPATNFTFMLEHKTREITDGMCDFLRTKHSPCL